MIVAVFDRVSDRLSNVLVPKKPGSPLRIILYAQQSSNERVYQSRSPAPPIRMLFINVRYIYMYSIVTSAMTTKTDYRVRISCASECGECGRVGFFPWLRIFNNQERKRIKRCCQFYWVLLFCRRRQIYIISELITLLQ